MEKKTTPLAPVRKGIGGQIKAGDKCAFVCWDYSPLRQTMQERGLDTFRKLRDLSGISVNSVADINAGRAIASEVVAKICYALDCQPGQVYAMSFLEAPALGVALTDDQVKAYKERLEREKKADLAEQKNIEAGNATDSGTISFDDLIG